MLRPFVERKENVYITLCQINGNNVAIVFRSTFY